METGMELRAPGDVDDKAARGGRGVAAFPGSWIQSSFMTPSASSGVLKMEVA